MATTAKRVEAALVRAGLRGRFSAIDDNNGEVVLWRDGAGIPVWSVREAMEEARKDEAAISLGRRGGKVTSAAKTASARANGAKGGRPKKTTRRMPMIALLAIALLLAGCATPPHYSMPSMIDRATIAPVSPWAGTPVIVEDGRLPAVLHRAYLVQPGLPSDTWERYSTTLVQETRRALLDALGPARGDAPAELRVVIREHVATFDRPNWVGSTILEAEVVRVGVATDGGRLTAHGKVSRWNWNGYATAELASQRAYEAAVQDLLRQLALTRPPTQ